MWRKNSLPKSVWREKSLSVMVTTSWPGLSSFNVEEKPLIYSWAVFPPNCSTSFQAKPFSASAQVVFPPNASLQKWYQLFSLNSIGSTIMNALFQPTSCSCIVQFRISSVHCLHIFRNLFKYLATYLTNSEITLDNIYNSDMRSRGALT